jgi:predicted SprT family Zn-dependent metalloprotease
VKRLAELLDLFAGTDAAPAAPPSPAPEPERVPVLRPEPSAAAGPAAEVLAAVRTVAPQFRRVVFTRNRRVMASVSRGGADLRLNAAFAEAPRDVLVAVGRMFTARDGRTRRRAREAVIGFVRGIAVPQAPPRPRRRTHVPDDAPHVARLRAEFDRVNAAHFGGALPSVPIHLSGRMRRRNGHFSSHPPEIVISRHLCTHGEDGEAERTMRHEMIHLWQHASGGRPDHGKAFRAWARRLDVHPRATRPVRWKSSSG